MLLLNLGTISFDSIPEDKIITREASKSIVLEGNKILMMKNKYGDYKFPGGGLEKGETFEDALKREILEETGNSIIGNLTLFCTVEESKIDDMDKSCYFKMFSKYWICRIEENKIDQNLDSYEKEIELKPIWVDVHEAYRTNCNLLNGGNVNNYWVKRETKVLELLIKNYFDKIKIK